MRWEAMLQCKQRRVFAYRYLRGMAWHARMRKPLFLPLKYDGWVNCTRLLPLQMTDACPARCIRIHRPRARGTDTARRAAWN